MTLWEPLAQSWMKACLYREVYDLPKEKTQSDCDGVGWWPIGGVIADISDSFQITSIYYGQKARRSLGRHFPLVVNPLPPNPTPSQPCILLPAAALHHSPQNPPLPHAEPITILSTVPITGSSTLPASPNNYGGWLARRVCSLLSGMAWGAQYNRGGMSLIVQFGHILLNWIICEFLGVLRVCPLQIFLKKLAFSLQGATVRRFPLREPQGGINSHNGSMSSQYYFHMSRSASRSLVVTLVAVLLVAHCAAADCSAASNSTCGLGHCQGYIMINGLCTPICAAGTYYQPLTGLCLSCSSLGPAYCSQLCPGYFFLASNTSSSGNSTNTTSGSNNTNSTTPGTTCQPCSAYYGLTCVACTASVCTKCAVGHQLDSTGQTCVATSCNITNCVLCSGSTGCYLCEPGFTVSPNGTACLPVNCSVSYCSLCSGANCLACIDGYKLRGGKCKPICDLRCTNCVSPGVCAMCQSGYSLDTTSYTCRLNCSAAFDGHCASCQNLLFCTTCEQGYVPALNGAICQPVFTCSDPHCSACSIASFCKACNTGYYLSNGTCNRDICFIQNCKRCASVTTCATCMDDYILDRDSQACIPSCSVNIENCLICNGSSTCKACDMGYTLVDDKCVKLCNISGCALCMTNETCLVCDSGYLASENFTSCNVICRDPCCATCNSSASCITCKQGFSMHHGICTPSCRHGWAMNQHGTCQQCKHSLSHCESCYFDSSNTISCISCTPGYYLSSGSCFSCDSAVSNCRICNSPSTCSLCARGYVLFDGGCIQHKCQAKNCLICQTNSTTKCSTCATGFQVDSNANCHISCKQGQTLINGYCSCPRGTYLPQASGYCTSCTDANCLSCNVNSCSSCAFGYYPSGSACLPCIDNCVSCIDGVSCRTCQPPYVFSNGSCTIVSGGFNGGVSSSGGVFACDPGCSICAMTPLGVKVCTTVLEGYSSVGGNIIKCDSSCASCNGPTASDCLTCFSGSSLNNGICTKCTDPNALTCSSTDASFSLTCVKGWTAVMDTSASPSTSMCQLCAGNCYRCDVNGPGTCDVGQCQIGYVQQPGNKNCTQCFGGCSSCDPNNLMNCLSCGPRRYTDPTTGQCTGCPSGCQNCNSSLVCTSCFPNYMMVGTLCQVSPTWPCIQEVNGVCTACVVDYAVKDGICDYSSNCSATATCSNCPYGYYLSNVTSNLQGICSPCPAISHCLTCSSVQPSDCFLCNNGYYVNGTGDCAPCPKGCLQCSSGDYCTLAADGYYLVSGADGTPSGIAGKCYSPCQTCDVTPNFCLSCKPGYTINGSTCFSNKVAYYIMVFNLPIIFNDDDSFEIAYGKICNNIGYFRTTICQNMPKQIRDLDLSCRSNFNFIRFAQGSVLLEGAFDISNFTSPEEAVQALQDSKLIPSAQVLSTSISTPTSTNNSSDSSSTNLGLILGVSIPLGLLLIVIISIIIYAKTNKDKEIDIDDSGKPIEYDQIEQDERRRGENPGRGLNEAPLGERVDRH